MFNYKNSGVRVREMFTTQKNNNENQGGPSGTFIRCISLGVIIILNLNRTNCYQISLNEYELIYFELFTPD